MATLRRILSLCVLSATFVAAKKEITELSLPRLFHLDDYDRCLAAGGLYCTGTFKLTQRQSISAYSHIQEYSSDPRHFNRTLIHRGYCISARCPSSELNTTLRFERCVDQHALVPGLKASILSHTCSNQKESKDVDTAELAFLCVIGLLVALNVVGTLYDVIGYTKNPYIMAWSLRYNWNRLTTTEDGDPRLTSLTPIQGVRVLLLVLVMMTHTSEIQHKLYLYNPNQLEQLLQHPATMLIRNGSALVMGFVVISNFLFAYSLLHISKTRKLSLAQLPMCLLHRLVRLAPVHLVVVGFAATWWRRVGDGPQWQSVVAAESDVCRRKFLSHVFFLQNLVNPDEHCLLQTWFLAVDVQLYIMAAALTLWLQQTGRRAVPLLTALFFGSCLLNVILAYVNDWKSLLYIMLPENVRNTFRTEPSFYRFYVAPWGSLPACLLGLWLAHVHYNIQESGLKVFNHKILRWIFHLMIPIHVALIKSGSYIEDSTSRLTTALYLGVERPLFAILAAFYVLGFVNNVDNFIRRIMSIRFLQVAGRLSLSALMLHWCVNLILVGSRRTLSEVSVSNIASDLISTIWWTYVIALPLSLLVEAPFQKTLNTFILSLQASQTHTIIHRKPSLKNTRRRKSSLKKWR
ncbi:uncharacterized protein LOC110997081 [Pieris rapae]|uniref:uncharacterized protein LOC110997081 n=1 Tax=Pieris rapae TaxID=64459 RepID=UPI001E27F81E|nr:uncharacterized protein LOC110997081 [Pieris rapae]